MTESKIHFIYKLISLSLLIVSLILILIPSENHLLEERIISALVMNIGFHMFYFALSIVPLKQLNWLNKNSNTQNFAYSLLIVFSYFVIGICVLSTILIIKDVISYKDVFGLIPLLVILGVILGSLKLNMRSKNWKKNALQQRV